MLHFYIMLPLIYMSLNIAFSDFSLVLYSNLEKILTCHINHLSIIII